MCSKRGNYVVVATLALLVTSFLAISVFPAPAGWLPHKFSIFQTFAAAAAAEDASMGGLLLPPRPGSHGSSCISRSQHHLYGRRIKYKPSRYLVSKLRLYETRHQRCAGEAENFAQILRSNISSSNSNNTCKFVVWISFEGLGNKMLSLTSAFLYALVTDRVLLLDRSRDMPQLFCEAVPEGPSWFLPEKNFPHDWMYGLNSGSDIKLGRLVDKGNCTASAKAGLLPHIAYMHLDWFSSSLDKRFFCEDEQKLVQQYVGWLFVRANAYYIPALYLLPSFRQELDRLFPEPETMFRYAARYLLHPTNNIWGRTTRYYSEYLSGGDRLVGLQLRPFDAAEATLQTFSDQLWSCVLKENLLPNVSRDEENIIPNVSMVSSSSRFTSVLVTSLHKVFVDELSERFLKYPTLDGSLVKVHSPSHEGVQRTDDLDHDQKALMEMLLLSMSDDLVTSPRSTFGYIAHALAGLQPWTLRGLQGTQVEEPVCTRMGSPEPCFLLNPPVHDCDCQGSPRLPSHDVVKPCLDDPGRGIQIVPRAH